MKMRLKYVVEDTDRHGNVRLYYRRDGRKVRLRGPAGSPEFLTDYRAAAAGPITAKSDGKQVGRVVPRSMKWLCVEYYKSAMFKELDPRTQKVRRSILERFCQNKGDGDKPYALLQPRHIRIRRDEMSDKPEAANGMVKALRQLFRYALRYDHHDDNPAEKVEYLSGSAEGFHSWTLEEIKKFETKHPIGTVARLALALALYTGQRRADLVLLGRQHVRQDNQNQAWLVFTQHKGRNRKRVGLEIPIIPELQRIIDATKTGDLTYLVTAFNRPFTSNGFGNRFRKWCDEAELPNCSVHGLRKAAAARLAELGCTEFEIMAITGHTTSKEVTRYTRSASQKTRAESALRRMSDGQIENKSVPLSKAVATSGTKATSKPLIIRENIK